MFRVSGGMGQRPNHHLQHSDVDDVCFYPKIASSSGSFSLADGLVSVRRRLTSLSIAARTYLLTLSLATSSQRWPRLRLSIASALALMLDDPFSTSCNS